ncbi:MAG: serpin family protein [Clostridiales bacterium]|nr:serpin family protein [Clostridiales bacterium]
MIKKIGSAAMAAMMFMAIFTGCSDTTSNTHQNTMSDDLMVEHVNGQGVFNDVVDLSFEKGVDETGYIDFVFNACGSCCENNDDNVMISPASILFALEMAGAGANGNTLDEMSSVLVPGASNEEALGFAADYYHELRDDGKDYFTLSNGIFLNDSKADKFYKDYIEYINMNFDAQTDILPFNDSAVDKINEWVNTNTDGMIPFIIEQLDDQDAAVIVNAITFNGKWEKEYSEDHIRENYTFTNAAGEEETVTLLTSTEGVYLESDKATGFIKNYDGGKYALVGILPKDESLNGNEFLSDFTSEDYKKLLASAKSTEVAVGIPEFSYDYSNETFADVLESLGMKDAFTKAADFSNMSKEELYISRVIHKTHIDLNRDGTEAAAATAVVMRVKGVSEDIISYEVILNRPFAYMIVDTETDTPIFIGSVNYVNE